MNTSQRKGMASIEALLGIATGALILLGMMQMANSSLLPKMNDAVADVFSFNFNSQSSSSDSSGESNSNSSDTSDSGSDSDGNSNSQNQGSGNDRQTPDVPLANGGDTPVEDGTDRSNSGGAESGDTSLPEPETIDPPSDIGEATPIGDDLATKFIGESIKQGAKDYADAAVEIAKEELENYLPSRLPLGVDLGLEDWDLKQAELNQSLVRNVGIVTGALGAVDGLTQAEQRVKDLADEGKYREAFGTIFSGSSSFITDTVLNSKVVDAAVGKLPSSVQVAIQTTIPNAVESVTQAVGEKVFDSVGKKINDKLWSWYDKGYLPRAPRIPRDYNFDSGG